MPQNIYQKRISEWGEKYGGLSLEVQKKIDKLVEQYDKTQNIKQGCITNGIKLIREFKGKTYSVMVIPDVYEFDGKKYKSLSAIANEITGKH